MRYSGGGSGEGTMMVRESLPLRLRVLVRE